MPDGNASTSSATRSDLIATRGTANGMRSPTCLLESRVYSSKNLRSTVQKDFCSKICQERTCATSATAKLAVQRTRESAAINPTVKVSHAVSNPLPQPQDR